MFCRLQPISGYSYNPLTLRIQETIGTMKKEVDLMADGETEIDNKCSRCCRPKNYLTIRSCEKMDVVEKIRSEASSFRELTQPVFPLAIKFHRGL